jgi:hypothetical protein
MVWPSPVRTKSSMVSAWAAARGRDKAEARRARVKRELCASRDSLRVVFVDSGCVCGLRMRRFGRGVKMKIGPPRGARVLSSESVTGVYW